MSNKLDNVFFVCSLIEYISRKTKNKKKYIVEKIGRDKLEKIYDLSSVYHSENIEKITDELIYENEINNGNYDVLYNNKNSNPPSFWDMGKVYVRLIRDISDNENDYIDKLVEVMTSWIIEKFDNYDSSLYFENPSYIYNCYIEGKIL